MDVPRVPNVLMFDSNDNIYEYDPIQRGDLLDALSVKIYFE